MRRRPFVVSLAAFLGLKWRPRETSTSIVDDGMIEVFTFRGDWLAPDEFPDAAVEDDAGWGDLGDDR